MAGENLNTFIKVLDVTNSPPPSKVGIMQYQYNTWDIYGSSVGMNTRYQDSAHVQQYGKTLWDARRDFPEARAQAALSAIAVALKSWQGMQHNPPHFTVDIYDEPRIKLGYKVRYQNSNYTLSETASSYLVVKNKVDLKTTVQTITFTQSIVKRR